MPTSARPRAVYGTGMGARSYKPSQSARRADSICPLRGRPLTLLTQCHPPKGEPNPPHLRYGRRAGKPGPYRCVVGFPSWEPGCPAREESSSAAEVPCIGCVSKKINRGDKNVTTGAFKGDCRQGDDNPSVFADFQWKSTLTHLPLHRGGKGVSVGAALRGTK